MGNSAEVCACLVLIQNRMDADGSHLGNYRGWRLIWKGIEICVHFGFRSGSSEASRAQRVLYGAKVLYLLGK